MIDVRGEPFRLTRLVERLQRSQDLFGEIAIWRMHPEVPGRITIVCRASGTS